LVQILEMIWGGEGRNQQIYLMTRKKRNHVLRVLGVEV
jgi:hypothetical protein